jgi:radical SAM protein (TIGR01212 family)
MLDSTSKYFERYNALNQFLKDKFGVKVYKVSLHGFFSCPNRDGTKGLGGCIYCNPESNLPSRACNKPVKTQLLEGIDGVKKRHHADKFISYFQHYSNTYRDAKELRRLYLEALDHPDVVGLAVSTRPDCIDDGVLKLLEELNGKTYLWVELGLQSAHDGTLKFLNRHHTIADFTRAIGRLRASGILTCAHVILGLPGETRADMMDTIDFLVAEKIGGIKIHNLHVLKDTPLAKMYAEGAVKTLSLEDYACLVVDCLERLPKEVLIHRFNSHSPRWMTVAPEWSINKLGTMNAVHDELLRRDSWQGKGK